MIEASSEMSYRQIIAFHVRALRKKLLSADKREKRRIAYWIQQLLMDLEDYERKAKWRRGLSLTLEDILRSFYRYDPL